MTGISKARVTLPPGQEQEFRSAFNELVTRVHGQQLDDFAVAVEGVATDLPEEEIPPLSDSEIAMLRSRMENTLPEMPRRLAAPRPWDTAFQVLPL